MYGFGKFQRKGSSTSTVHYQTSSNDYRFQCIISEKFLLLIKGGLKPFRLPRGTVGPEYSHNSSSYTGRTMTLQRSLVVRRVCPILLLTLLQTLHETRKVFFKRKINLLLRHNNVNNTNSGNNFHLGPLCRRCYSFKHFLGFIEYFIHQVRV